MSIYTSGTIIKPVECHTVPGCGKSSSVWSYKQTSGVFFQWEWENVWTYYHHANKRLYRIDAEAMPDEDAKLSSLVEMGVARPEQNPDRIDTAKSLLGKLGIV